MTVSIRPFQTADRTALQTIGADTAFFGAPIETYMEDRRIFMDAFYAYYTDYEPEHAWVACDGSQVVGFLTGAVNTPRHDQIMRQKILPAVLWKFLRGQYRPGLRTLRYSLGVFMAGLRHEFPAVDLERYPAHLHINLLPQWRRQGLGRKLIEAYLEQLKQLGIPGVHLGTTNQNIIACFLYESIGFRLLSARKTRMYAAFTNQPVELRSYGMDLVSTSEAIQLKS